MRVYLAMQAPDECAQARHITKVPQMHKIVAQWPNLCLPTRGTELESPLDVVS